MLAEHKSPTAHIVEHVPSEWLYSVSRDLIKNIKMGEKKENPIIIILVIIPAYSV